MTARRWLVTLGLLGVLAVASITAGHYWPVHSAIFYGAAMVFGGVTFAAARTWAV